MKNKKAEQFTLAETMKILLAVVSIGLLLYLAASMYGIFTKKTQIEQARATIEELKNSIDSKKTEFTIFSPTYKSGDYWYLVSFPGENGNLPEICEDNKWKYCLCIESFQDIYSSQNLIVSNAKVCTGSDKKYILKTKTSKLLTFSNFGIIELYNPPIILKISYDNKDEININRE